jgi:hypothetical protein
VVAIYENAIGSNAITSEIEYSDEEKTAIEVGEYFLENYNNQNFSKEGIYYIDANDKDIPYDLSIVKKCTENEFYWVAFYDEHTVFIYKGAFFHTARGYLVTDGTTPEDVAEKSEKLGFDENSMEIAKAISDRLYYVRAGL